MQKYWFCSQTTSVVTPDDSWHVWFLFVMRQTFHDTTSQEDEWDVVRFPTQEAPKLIFFGLQGNKDPKAEQQERKDNLPSLWRSPASESSRADAQMLLLLSPLSWCDHLQSSNLPCPRSALHKCGTRHFVTEQETSLSWRCHYKASIKTVWSFFSVTKLICSNRNSDLSDRHCVILPLLAPALL